MAEPVIITTPTQLEELVERAVARAVAGLARADPANQLPQRILEEVLTVQEGASEAKCSPKTIRAACCSCAIRAHQPPGLKEWRFTRAALLGWLQRDSAQKAEATPSANTLIDQDAGPRQAAAKLLDRTR